MIDLRDVRELRTDYVMLGAVSIAFVLGGASVELERLGIAAAPLAIGVGIGVVWYLDEVARIPDVSHAEAAEDLRRAADELDRLDELRQEHGDDVEDDEDVDEAIGEPVDEETVQDLADRSELDADDVPVERVDDEHGGLYPDDGGRSA